MTMSNTDKAIPHFIIYIDLLGIKNKINSKNNNEYLLKIQNIYNKSLSLIEQYRHMGGVTNLKCKIFSDNMLFATEVYEQKNYGIGTNINSQIVTFMSILTIFIQQYALDEGILTRGAITIGDLFINDVFTYGKGLVNAYVLESDVAIFPRVILDEKVLIYLDKVQTVNINGCKIYSKDFDNYYYVNYLSYIFRDINLGDIYNTLKNLQEEVVSEKIKQKHYWLINKYNELCKLNNQTNYAINIDSSNRPYLYIS